MVLLVSILISFGPASHAKVPSAADECTVLLADVSRPDVPAYTRWLLDDGVVKPIAQIDVLLTKYERIGERHFMSDLADALGPAGDYVPRVSKMQKLARQITFVSRGYQALLERCARITNDLARNKDYTRDMLAQTVATLDHAERYLVARPGVDATWVRDHVVRARFAADQFRVRCVETPPAQVNGRFEDLKRIFWP